MFDVRSVMFVSVRILGFVVIRFFLRFFLKLRVFR